MARRRPSEPTVNPARGAALVVVAVVIGLFLLRNGLDTSETITNQPGVKSGTNGDSNGDSDGPDETTTTAPPAVRPPAEVPTIVLNGSGVTGAAAAYSTSLAAAGYQLTNPTGANADGDNVATTVVLFASGFEAEAAAVAAAIGAPTIVPEALPTVPPGQIAGASVVVVLGTDLGSVPPPAAAAPAT